MNPAMQPPWFLRGEGLSLSFGGVQVLADVSFTLGHQEVLGIVGPNGAGKTSLLNVISRIYEPSAGTIQIRSPDGGYLDLLKLPATQLARHGVARTFQNIEITPDLSVLDNVLTGRHHLERTMFVEDMLWLGRSRRADRVAREQCREVLDLVGLSRVAAAPVTTLPYGMRKRVELARALAMQPRLLLLDEPAAGLNTHETDEIAAAIEAVQQARICSQMLIEHDMELVTSVCDQVLVLNYGRTIVQADPHTVTSHPEVVAAYLGPAAQSEIDAVVRTVAKGSDPSTA
ncbi:ABC transporter ATP-binding protein [Dactylosporangium fulvum]|uniref:ABC transporter ATP-binding protein n=1 Tax=Dactylosporangium fulvum TaxID=53359 RepID=A0ABY5VT37_9ACTN|nr:ABC transporter ATP-binding protein [Dactylosporangium fulvum]UWP80254.1 ABC transporter ATP-binding protein [Dactylosporangium fulvum]